jgi:putative lysine/arginine/ornithine/histidine/octopine transport system permease protein
VLDLHGFGPLLLQGLWTTLRIAVASLAIGLVLGLLGAAAKLSRFPWLRIPVDALTNLIRGLPELLVIFLFYFGGSQLLTAISGEYVEVNQFAAGTAALSLTFGAYASETFRGAFLAVPAGQVEAARAFGMRPRQVFFRIQLPQLWRYALPGLGNLWLVLTKDTALVSIIGLVDLMRSAAIAIGTTKQPFLFYGAAALIYFAITVVSMAILARLERRARRGVPGGRL